MRKRLDQLLVDRGLVPTRARARDLVLRGEVRVDETVVVKPARQVEDGSTVAVAGRTDYVSRGAVKLEAALYAFAFDPKGRVALDIGASTGGFTEVLRARGASKVYAVDVGHGQLHEKLRRDPHVVSLEGMDARRLSARVVADPVTAIVADVSFISLAKALPQALALAARGAWLVALVKPQFEVGPAHVGKDGIVRDAQKRERAAEEISAWLSGQPGWRVLGLVPSPIGGGSGNREFLLGAHYDG